MSDTIAYLRNAQPDAEDEALVVCAKGDPGAFPVGRLPEDWDNPESLSITIDSVRDAFNKALDFALDTDCAEPLEFLRAWREGDTSEWPEFQE